MPGADFSSLIHLVPGPVSVPERVLEAMRANSDHGRIKADFLDFYTETGRKAARVLGTRHEVILMSGEAMVVLWGVVRSCLAPGERLLCIDTGVFGAGFADMGKAAGCSVKTVSFPPDSTINQGDALQKIEEAVRSFRPKMITLVHCETPSGTLNPLEGVGEIKRRLRTPLLCVDAVASVGGAPVEGDRHAVDLLLGGTQKALSAPPCLGFAAISPEAGEEIAGVGYQGYDAFLPFIRLKDSSSLPYVPFRQGVAALNAALDLLLEEGLERAFARHERAAGQCRAGAAALGLELFPSAGAVNSPTVSAFKVPPAIGWPAWRERLAALGLIVGGSLGPLEGRVFRLGHMGSQARPEIVEKALRIMAQAL
ncbi:MAG: aminotransferase class V-fold PLP-dependent enzyme [Deltaproteobacteria bacterium]|jgi:aspartate aminotransferase-like enzyme|nr:aminotransferase class V-fold PLP-dependent enzyme [Deltaproteobacteria bacterium]